MALNKIRSLIVDRIGITVVIGSKDLFHKAESQLYKLMAKQSVWVPSGKINVTQEEYLKRLDYYAEFGKSAASKRKIADITVGANKLFGGKKVHRYLKLTLYPSKFKVGDFETFKDALKTEMPDFNYSKLYYAGNVNYLELASDTLSQTHHSFVPYRKYCNKSEIFKENDGYLGTTYIGSTASNFFFRLYDKRKQLLDKKKPLITDAAVHTRIEAALGRLGPSVATLIGMPNPFSKLQITDLDQAKAQSDDEDWQHFLVECLTVNGAPDALAKRSKYLRKKYLGMLDAAPAWWWKPELVWERLPEALARIAP